MTKVGKVRSSLLSYFIHMRRNVNGSIFCKNNENIDFEEKQDSKELSPRPLAHAPKTFNSKITL